LSLRIEEESEERFSVRLRLALTYEIESGVEDRDRLSVPDDFGERIHEDGQITSNVVDDEHEDSDN
jgi:hypothetical protein